MVSSEPGTERDLERCSLESLFSVLAWNTHIRMHSASASLQHVTCLSRGPLPSKQIEWWAPSGYRPQGHTQVCRKDAKKSKKEQNQTQLPHWLLSGKLECLLEQSENCKIKSHREHNYSLGEKTTWSPGHRCLPLLMLCFSLPFLLLCCQFCISVPAPQERGSGWIMQVAICVKSYVSQGPGKKKTLLPHGAIEYS